MRRTRIAVFTGAAVMILAGVAGMAKAQPPEEHVMTLRLPDGRIEQIRTVGDVAPTVVVAPEAGVVEASPFALLAEMERQEAAMLRMIDAMGGPGFGMMTAAAGPGVCSRSVQITFNGNGQAPHVVSQTSGDCGGVPRRAMPAMVPDAPARRPAPHLIEARADNGFPG
jgi:hypothetical protein